MITKNLDRDIEPRYQKSILTFAEYLAYQRFLESKKLCVSSRKRYIKILENAEIINPWEPLTPVTKHP